MVTINLRGLVKGPDEKVGFSRTPNETAVRVYEQ